MVIVHPSDRPESGLGGAADAVVDLSIEAVISIFAAYGLSLQMTRRAAPGVRSVVKLGMEAGVGTFDLGALVNFAGPEVRGSLLLASTADVIAPTRPCAPKRFAALAPPARTIMTRDWTGELANQVLGRMKTSLAGFGISFDTHPPVPLSDDALLRVAPKASDTRLMLFRSPGGAVGFWFDIVCSGDVMSTAVPPTSTKRVLLF